MNRPQRARSEWRPRVWLAAGLVAIAGLSMPAAPALAQQQNPAAELARVADLKGEAFAALRAGEFDRTSDLIAQAAKLAANDGSLSQMRAWLASYQQRASANQADRQKQYDEAVENVRKLRDAGFETYAADATANAFLHVIDKDAFPKEPWVKDVLGRAVTLAGEAEAKGDWLTARRLYTDLSAIEPLNPTWRKKINDVSRRLGLLAMYAPDSLIAVYDAEAPTRQKVAQLIDPKKGAATKPADDGAMNDDFKIDWKQMLGGVKVDMLAEALQDAAERYYRPTNYGELVAGGIDGLDLLVTTSKFEATAPAVDAAAVPAAKAADKPGLDATFPKLADAGVRDAFVAKLDAIRDAVKADKGAKDRRLVSRVLSQVLEANRDTVQLPEEVVIYEFANGATAVLDPFSNVIWPYDLIEFQKSTQGEFTGVGVQIRENEDGYLEVVSPLPDSPAYKAGIHADDVITQINGKNAKGVTTLQAVKAITGPRRLAGETDHPLGPTGNVKEFDLLRRAKINVASVKGWTPGAGRRSGIGWSTPTSGIGVRAADQLHEASRAATRSSNAARPDQGRAGRPAPSSSILRSESRRPAERRRRKSPTSFLSKRRHRLDPQTAYNGVSTAAARLRPRQQQRRPSACRP